MCQFLFLFFCEVYSSVSILEFMQLVMIRYPVGEIVRDKKRQKEIKNSISKKFKINCSNHSFKNNIKKKIQKTAKLEGVPVDFL